MKKEVKIIVGANWGDEGKGLATDYFAHKAISEGKKTLVVLHNGSCQRSHTVSLKDGTRHAFRHFGSGTFAGADTYFTYDFIVNPIYFMEELNRLELEGFFPNVFINDHCRIATPIDAMYSQMVERARGDGKHGGCGLGVFETIKRCKFFKENNLPSRFRSAGAHDGIFDFYRDVLDYYLYLTRNANNRVVIQDVYAALEFTDSYYKMRSNTYMIGLRDILMMYDCIIFEGGQGLALDMNNDADFPHLTPSRTGSFNPMKYMTETNINFDVEVCYVTRSYFTKHGAGRFKTECKKEDINKDIEDLTNVPNPFQDSIRYGRMDIDDMVGRIDSDYKTLEDFDAKKSIMVTHLNYHDFDFDKLKGFDKIYKSDGMYREDVKEC